MKKRERNKYKMMSREDRDEQKKENHWKDTIKSKPSIKNEQINF